MKNIGHVYFARKIVRLTVGIVLGACSIIAQGETTFLANYDNTSASGNARFESDFKTGTGGGTYVSGAPALNTSYLVPSGAASAQATADTDGVYYTGLSQGNINRDDGVAEAFFYTTWTLSSNNKTRAFLSGWVGYSSPAGTRWYWALTADANSTMRLVFGDNSVTPNKALTLTCTPTWVANQWHHVLVAWKNNAGATDVVRLYVDGTCVASTSTADIVGTGTIAAADNRVYVGMTSSGGSQNLEGYIDSVRLDNTSAAYDGTTFTTPKTQQWRNLRPFVQDSPTWTTYGGDPPTFQTLDHRLSYYHFGCDMNSISNGGRGDWKKDLSPALDLSKMSSLISYVKMTNSAAVSTITFYFGTTAGDYYAGNIYNNVNAPLYNGLSTIALDKDNFTATGAPNWANITWAKISLWKKTDATGTVTLDLYNLEQSGQAAAGRAFAQPEYDFPTPTRLDRRDLSNVRLESRTMFDEGPWYLDNGSTAVLDRLASAKLNTYIPCVWHGRGAIYNPTTGATKDWFHSNHFTGQNPDPLDDLITAAHDRSPRIEVHGWFTISLRMADIYSQWAPTDSTLPKVNGFDQFDLQISGFRDFIVTEIVEFAKRYDVDGINLDYIRTQGVSESSTAQSTYNAIYGAGSYAADGIANYPNISATALARVQNWQDIAVRDIVQRVSSGVRAVKPWVTVSVSGHPKPEPLLSDEGRNEWKWVKNQWVDAAFAMDYDRLVNGANLAETRAGSPFPGRFVEILADYDSGTARNPELLNRQMDYSLRKFPQQGVGIYLYGTCFTDAQIAAMTASALPTAPYIGVFNDTAGAYFKWWDSFEGETVGANLTADARWTAYTGTGYEATAYIASSPVPTGSTRSAKFQDLNGFNQIYWFNLPTLPSSNRTMASVEFDFYADNRTSTNINFEVRASTGTGSSCEAGLLITQPTPSTCRLYLSRSGGSDALTNSSTDIAVKTWHRIKFRTDIANNTYSVYLDGNTLAENVTYVPIATLTSIGNFQWRNLGTDEDVYIDNVVVQDN